MAFAHAVQRLVDAHASEIAHLEAQLSALRGQPPAVGSLLRAEENLYAVPHIQSQTLRLHSSNGVNIHKKARRGQSFERPRTPRRHITPRSEVSARNEGNLCVTSDLVTCSEISCGIPSDTCEVLSNALGNRSAPLINDTAKGSLSDEEDEISNFSDSVARAPLVHAVLDKATPSEERWMFLLMGLLSSLQSHQLNDHPGWSRRGSRKRVSRSGSDLGIEVRREASEADVASILQIEDLLVQKKLGAHNIAAQLDAITGSSRRSRGIIMHPASKLRACWMYTCLICVIVEVGSISVSPFDMLHTDMVLCFDVGSALLWTMDIVLNFFSGLYVNGRLEMRPQCIAKAYLRGWFLFDFVLVLTQWFALVADGSSVFSSTAVAFKLARFTRSLRLGRKMIRMTEDSLQKDGFTYIWSIIRLLVALFVFVHCSACLWYEVGKSHGGWVSQYQHLLKDSPAHNYLISLHFAFSQLQGSIDIYPGNNSWERLYVVTSSYLSIVVLAMFVSSITDALFSARQEGIRKRQESALVRGFFERNSVDVALQARANHFLACKERLQRGQEQKNMDNQALELFPSQLKRHLIGDIRACYLCWHPTFYYLRKTHSTVFVRLCAEALLEHASEPNQDLFMSGQLSKQVYVIGSGNFVFNMRLGVLDSLMQWFDGGDLQAEKATLRKSPTSASSQSMSTIDSEALHLTKTTKSSSTCSKLDIICEAALWVRWRHEAELCSLDFGDYFTIEALGLIDLLREYPRYFSVFASYATRFSRAAKLVVSNDYSKKVPIELMSFEIVVDIEVEEGRRKSSKFRSTVPGRGSVFRAVPINRGRNSSV